MANDRSVATFFAGEGSGVGGWFRRRQGSEYPSALNTMRSVSLQDMQHPTAAPAGGASAAAGSAPRGSIEIPRRATTPANGDGLSFVSAPAAAPSPDGFTTPASPDATAGAAAGATAATAGGSATARHRLAELMRLGAAVGERQLFNGLRVRMGVATGEVPYGTEIKNSALFELAKSECDST
jgi:hypothetical protein